MFRGQVSRSRGQARPSIDVHWFREILVLRSLDHDLLANVAERVRDRARWYVATEHVAHVFSGRSVSGHVSEVPEEKSFVDMLIYCEGKRKSSKYYWLPGLTNEITFHCGGHPERKAMKRIIKELVRLYYFLGIL